VVTTLTGVPTRSPNEPQEVALAARDAGWGATRTSIIGAVSAFGALMLMSSVQLLGYRRVAGEETTIAASFLFGVATWGAWMLGAPLVLLLGRRFDFSRGRRMASTAAHLPLLLLLTVASTALVFNVGQALFGEQREVPWSEILQQSLAGSRLHAAIILYAALLVLARAIEARRALGEESARAARSEALATRSQLSALAARLQPHFLFNSLHAVGALIDEDPVKARSMLAQLGDLLRDALAESESGDVDLAEEFRLLERYLAIEAMRFTDRLRVRLAYDPGVAQVRVPRFLLQPLVENALHHGIAPSAAGGTVTVTAHAVGSDAHITVRNDGAPFAADTRERGGLGTTRERLRVRYGGAARLTVGASDEGTGVTVVVPLTAPDAA
jgi:two-component system LytT family sensor kinase